ncbi:hypothetical protein KAR91_07985 [Candidatus Pacearchaeota archaeon]|nr:hypothetical protein [Candidatus Pacearchaeota archaeon]
MAKKAAIIVEVDRFLTQTRISVCSTINCANRKNNEFECNLKEIMIEEGRCISIIEQKRDDILG